MPFLSVLLIFAQPDPALLRQAWVQVDGYVRHHMAQEQVPGLALAVTTRAGLLRQGVWGYADLGAQAPVTTATRFQVGSVSKSVTAAALLQLREEGMVELDRPITTYLPWFEIRSPHEPVTLHHLLNHTGGLPRDRDDVPTSLYAAVALREREVGGPPGVRFAYSNIGYQVLSLLMEEVEGRPFPEIIRTRILEPLGMTDTEPAIAQETRLRSATGYQYFFDDRPPHPSRPVVPAFWAEHSGGDGNLASTAADIAALARMYLNGGDGPAERVLSRESFTMLTLRVEPAPDLGLGTSYGYGIVRSEFEGNVVLWHSGGMPGFRAMMLADVDAGLGVAVLMNGPGNPRRVAEYALRAYRAALEGEAPPPILIPDPPAVVPNAREYAGTYTDSAGRSLRVVAAGDTLLLLDGAARHLMERYGPDAFLVVAPGWDLFPVRFGREGGRVVELMHGGDWYPAAEYRGPREFDFPREWVQYTGHFRAANPWLNNYRVVLRKGRLWLVSPEGLEEPLVPLERNVFRVGADPLSPERLVLDTVISGRALRAVLSGVSYYRSPVP
jgi:CubicO group peptidase (beta-lactamase class C family)